MRDECSLSNLLVRIFYGLLLFFPCCYAFWLALCKLSIVPPRNLLFGGIYASVLFGSCVLAACLSKGVAGVGGKWLAAWYNPAVLTLVIATASLLRIWVVFAFQNPPVSNYWEAHATAQTLLNQGISVFHPKAPAELAADETTLYHCLYPSWALYMLVLKNLYALFGSSIYVAQLLNVVLCAGIMLALYRLCSRYMGKPGMGLASAAIFGFWPVSILSCTLHTPDYFTILLMAVALLLWAWAEERRARSPWWIQILRLSLLGVVLGLLNRFKSVAAVILAALAIYESVCHILPFLLRRLREGEKGFLKVLGKGTVIIVTVALCVSLTTQCVDWAIGRNIGHPPRNLTGWFFYVGLTGEDGMWTPEKRDFRDSLLKEYGYDIDAVNQALNRETLFQIRANPRETLMMIGEKTQTFWTDDLDLFWCMYGQTMDRHYDLIKGASRVFYMAFLLFLSLGALRLLLSSFQKKGALSKRRRPVFLTALLLFGFALMFLVSEMQIRYKFILAAPMSLVAGYGTLLVQEGFEKNPSVRPQRKERNKAGEAFPPKK